MTKVRGPLFSIKAAGTLGKSITYKKGVFGNVVRNYRRPKIKKTAGQQTVRWWFQRGVWTWQGKSGEHGYYFSRGCYGLEEPARASWRLFRTVRSLYGYYAFMKRWMEKSLIGEPQYQVPPFFGFCVADEWNSNFLYASGRFHDWTSPLPPPPGPPPTDQYVAGLVALWHMDVDEDPISDATGNGNTGAENGDPVNTGGKFSNCELFDGIGDYFLVANESNFDFEYNDSFSILAWVRIDDNSSPNGIIGKQKGSGAYQGYYFGTRYVTEGKGLLMRLIHIHNAERIQRYSNTLLLEGTWYLAVATYNGSGLVSGIKLYLNGVEDTPYTDVESDIIDESIKNDTAVRIGSTGESGFYPFKGKIDELGIVNRELSGAEILQIYNNNLPLRSTP